MTQDNYEQNPYAPHTQYARVPNYVAVEEPVVEAPAEEPVTEQAYESEVPTGSVSAVLKWVGDDVERAEAALKAEEEGQERSSLITKLKAVIKAD